MARYFKITEIDRDTFIQATGDDLDCSQLVVPVNEEVFVAVDEGLKSSVTAYCEAKKKKGYSPSVGYDLPREDCKESIKRRITLIREELLNISKEL